MRGISNNTIVAIIVVVVVAIVAVVVLGLVLGHHSNSSGTASSSTQQGTLNLILNNSTGSTETATEPVGIVGPSIVIYNPTTNKIVINATVYNPNMVDLRVTGVTIEGIPITISSNQNLAVPPGTHTLSIEGTSENELNLQPGTQVVVLIALSNGESVPSNAFVYQG